MGKNPRSFDVFKKNPRPSVGGKNSASSKVIVESLMEATLDSLKDNDSDRISTNQIAKKAGVSIGSFYQYFWNKNGVLAAVLRQIVDRNVESFRIELQKVSHLELAKKTEWLIQFSYSKLVQDPRLLDKLIRPTASGYFFSHLLEARRQVTQIIADDLKVSNPELVGADFLQRCEFVVNLVAQMMQLKIHLSQDITSQRFTDDFFLSMTHKAVMSCWYGDT